ncbi:RNA-directed DNA polymerase from mobile element jockey [Eumeta japonica]|uniref:RNA-directed DNA polymerase from mobile element jockey n=1 Tax=Eumeta variegata TaxID=151549 RepID=A0A4C1VA22_EUMVA|nr:RNA-directed DNA polymerase from mobile element jockey [Eumeta japonica]
MDDISTLAGQLQDWEEEVMLALYADGSAYLVSSCRTDLAVAKLQRVLDLLLDWLDKWRVAVIVTKTAALLTGQQHIMLPKLRLRGQEVEWQTRVRYLGVHIDRFILMAAQLTYAAPAWYAFYSASQKRRIQAQQNIALPMVMGAGWYVLNDVRTIRYEQTSQMAAPVTVRPGNDVKKNIMAISTVQLPIEDSF